MRTGVTPGHFLPVGSAMYVAATLHSGVLLDTVCKTMLFMVGLAKPCAFDGRVSKTINGCCGSSTCGGGKKQWFDSS